MKVNLELVIPDTPSDKMYLNYWDNINGHDICCEIVGGKIFKMNYDESGDVLSTKEIPFIDIINLIMIGIIQKNNSL